jgi:hypothetical protein
MEDSTKMQASVAVAVLRQTAATIGFDALAGINPLPAILSFLLLPLLQPDPPGPPPFSSMNLTGNLVRRYAALFPEARRGPRVAPSFRLYSARSCAVGFANVDSFVAQQIALSHHPESDNCEVMIKRVGEPYSRTLHDDEAACVDSGQFVEVGAPESHDRCRSRSSHERISRAPGRVTHSFHAKATSLLALRSRNVNVSMTTGTEV